MSVLLTSVLSFLSLVFACIGGGAQSWWYSWQTGALEVRRVWLGRFRTVYKKG